MIGPETCALGLGSNLGQSHLILHQALQMIDEIPGVDVQVRSQLYKTAPIGPPQPDYLNACALLQTTLSPEQLLQRLLRVEQQFGRIRRERWGARSLDLDILFYGNRVVQSATLDIPHPRLHERAFVLVPLNDIAPHWVHPVLAKAVVDLLTHVDQSGVEPFAGLSMGCELSLYRN